MSIENCDLKNHIEGNTFKRLNIVKFLLKADNLFNSISI